MWRVLECVAGCNGFKGSLVLFSVTERQQEFCSGLFRIEYLAWSYLNVFIWILISLQTSEMYPGIKDVCHEFISYIWQIKVFLDIEVCQLMFPTLDDSDLLQRSPSRSLLQSKFFKCVLWRAFSALHGSWSTRRVTLTQSHACTWKVLDLDQKKRLAVFHPETSRSGDGVGRRIDHQPCDQKMTHSAL